MIRHLASLLEIQRDLHGLKMMLRETANKRTMILEYKTSGLIKR